MVYKLIVRPTRFSGLAGPKKPSKTNFGTWTTYQRKGEKVKLPAYQAIQQKSILAISTGNNLNPYFKNGFVTSGKKLHRTGKLLPK